MNKLKRFLAYTDLHLTLKTPISRKDVFYKSLLIKLEEVYNLAKQYNVDAVFFMGDFFDKHQILCDDMIASAIEIIDSVDVNTYAVIGQHNLKGYNQESYEQSSLRFLEKFSTKYKTLIDPIFIGETTIYPCHWYDDLSTILAQNINKESTNILLAHQTVNDKPLMFNCLVTKDFKSEFDLILSGDWHGGYDVHKIDNTTWANPGALARRSIDDAKRPVQIALIEIENKQVKVEYLPLKNVKEDVFKENYLDLIKEKPIYQQSKFIDEIKSLNIQDITVKELIKIIGIQQKLKIEVFDYLLKKCE